MSARAVVTITFPDAAEAKAAESALRPDHEGHMRSRIEDGRGDRLVLEAESATPMGLLRSLDDALACLRATGVA